MVESVLVSSFLSVDYKTFSLDAFSFILNLMQVRG